MRFTAVFHDSDGRITSVQNNATENVIGARSYIKADFDGDPDDFYVADGEVRPKPDKPSDAHVFDYSSASWGLDINEARNQAWSRIKTDRESEEFSTFIWNSHTFQCDQLSQSRIMSAVQSAQIDSALSIVWTLSDNTTVNLNATELKQVGQALSTHIDACHTKARGLRSQIDAATTEVDLNAIKW